MYVALDDAWLLTQVVRQDKEDVGRRRLARLGSALARPARTHVSLRTVMEEEEEEEDGPQGGRQRCQLAQALQQSPHRRRSLHLEVLGGGKVGNQFCHRVKLPKKDAMKETFFYLSL